MKTALNHASIGGNNTSGIKYYLITFDNKKNMIILNNDYINKNKIQFIDESLNINGTDDNILKGLLSIGYINSAEYLELLLLLKS